MLQILILQTLFWTLTLKNFECGLALALSPSNMILQCHCMFRCTTPPGVDEVSPDLVSRSSDWHRGIYNPSMIGPGVILGTRPTLSPCVVLGRLMTRNESPRPGVVPWRQPVSLRPGVCPDVWRIVAQTRRVPWRMTYVSLRPGVCHDVWRIVARIRRVHWRMTYVSLRPGVCPDVWRTYRSDPACALTYDVLSPRPGVCPDVWRTYRSDPACAMTHDVLSLRPGVCPDVWCTYRSDPAGALTYDVLSLRPGVCPDVWRIVAQTRRVPWRMTYCRSDPALLPDVWHTRRSCLRIKSTPSKSRIWKFVFVKMFDCRRSMIFKDH